MDTEIKQVATPICVDRLELIFVFLMKKKKQIFLDFIHDAIQAVIQAAIQAAIWAVIEVVVIKLLLKL